MSSRSKVELDDRFAEILTDTRFADTSGIGVDAKGRVRHTKSGTLKKMYHLPEAENQHTAATDSQAGLAGTTSADAEERLEMLNALARGELALSSDEDDDVILGRAVSDSEESDSDAESADSNDLQQIAGPDLDSADRVPEEQVTTRLALVSCDWARLRAVDIFCVLSSFCPAGGRLKSVSVVPSDFGLQMMAEEARFGPRAVWKAAPQRGDDSDDAPADQQPAGQHTTFDSDSDAASVSTTEAEADLAAPSQYDGAVQDQAKLRQYELSRLKYYYAVITCSDISTARAIYTECDGMEFEASSNTFDLRFIPDEVDVVNEPRDAATSVPEDYTPPAFVTKALQSTEVELTWDVDPDDRRQVLGWAAAAANRRTKSAKQARKRAARARGRGQDLDDEVEAATGVAEDKFSAWIAGSSDDEADEQHMAGASSDDDGSDVDAGRMAQYKSLLAAAGIVPSAAKQGRRRAARAVESDSEHDMVADSDEEDSGEDAGAMTHTFVPGMADNAEKQLKEAAQSKQESTWEAYLRKRKERRAAKKEQARTQRKEAKVASAAAPEEAAGWRGDALFQAVSDEEEAQSSDEGAPGRQAGQEQAELALLMMDDEGRMGDDSDSDAERAERKAQARRVGAGSKRARRAAEAAQAAAAEVDLTDARFARVLTDPQMALDPTDAAWRETGSMRALMKARSKARSAMRSAGMDMAVSGQAEDRQAGLSSRVSALGAKFKQAKSGAAQMAQRSSAAAHALAKQPTKQRGQKQRGKKRVRAE